MEHIHAVRSAGGHVDKLSDGTLVSRAFRDAPKRAMGLQAPAINLTIYGGQVDEKVFYTFFDEKFHEVHSEIWWVGV